MWWRDQAAESRLSWVGHYFFDIWVDDVLSVDEAGVECQSEDQARLEALRALADIAWEEVRDRPRRRFVVRVRDERGGVLDAELTFNVTWTREG